MNNRSNRKSSGFFKRIMCLPAILFTFISFLSAAESASVTLPERKLLNEKNEPVPMAQLKGESDVLVLFFVASTCPVTTLYWERIKGAWYNYRQQKVRMVVVGGNSDDQPDLIRSKLKDSDLDLPVFWDPNHLLAKKLEIDHTPLVAVIGRDWQVCYRGRIDDFWRDETRVKKRYLDEAITAALSGVTTKDQMDDLFMGSAMR